MHSSVALGLAVPRSTQTSTTSSGSLGFTEMLPAEAHRIWWPHTVCRPITDHGMSDRPSSNCTAGTGSLQVTPPSVDFTTISWLSKSKTTSHAASFCPLMNWTYTDPSEATSGMENWSLAQAVPGPVDSNVHDGCYPEMRLGVDHVWP